MVKFYNLVEPYENQSTAEFCQMGTDDVTIFIKPIFATFFVVNSSKQKAPSLNIHAHTGKVC